MIPLRRPCIHVALGPVRAGKTEWTFAHMRRAAIEGPTLLLRPPTDTRALRSHAGRNAPTATVVCVGLPATLPAGVVAIGVEELQFWGPEIVPAAERWRRDGIAVAASGLDYDHLGGVFSTSADLFIRADVAEKLPAVCVDCFGLATRSRALVPLDGPVAVGGEELFAPVCRTCLEKYTR